ncbi:MAG: ribbon-helix-helix protein, CopG family [Hyphomicrobiales bacterium]
MKFAVSLPDELFSRLESRTEKTGKSRSAIVAAALQRFLWEAEQDELTRRVNELYDDEMAAEDEAWAASGKAQGRGHIQRGEW